MKKKFFFRAVTVASAAVVAVGATLAFAGCTTKYPKAKITYTFNSVDYEISYTLSRYDAPQTVQHFIELADAGYYDGLCVHNYDSNHLYTGGYTLGGEESDTLVEKDYFAEVKKLEEEGKTFTQSVWVRGSLLSNESPIYLGNGEDMTPTYTVYGEFSENGNRPKNGNEYYHSKGALVMYYTAKASDSTRVKTLRNDNGSGNGGDKYDTEKYYQYNSATSLFYTFMGSSDNSGDNNYAVFGKVDDLDDLQKLIDAIAEYNEEHESEEYSFTTENVVKYATKDPVDNVRRSGLEATYNTPVGDRKIIVKSVKITKY